MWGRNREGCRLDCAAAIAFLQRDWSPALQQLHNFPTADAAAEEVDVIKRSVWALTDIDDIGRTGGEGVNTCHVTAGVETDVAHDPGTQGVEEQVPVGWKAASGSLR